MDQRGQASDEVVHPGPGRRREHQVAHALAVGPHVRLAPGDQARALEQLGPVGAQLGEQNPQLLGGRVAARVGRAEVDQDDQGPGPFDVAQELVPEPLAAGGAFDQARGCRP